MILTEILYFIHYINFIQKGAQKIVLQENCFNK